MSAEENKTIVRRFLEEVVNTGNLALADRFIAPLIHDHNAGTEPLGLEAYKRHILAVRTTYPDFQVTIEDLIAEGEKVVARVTGHGTHLGRWWGVAPTGKQVTITGINIDRIVDGKVVEHWGEADTVSALLQIEAIAEPE
jgi:predicted ester cyclase